MRGHCAEAAVYFIISSVGSQYCPIDNVIFENPLVKLMQEVGGHTRKDVAVWEVDPEWVNGAKVLGVKLGWIEASRLLG